MAADADAEFPHALDVRIPLPSRRYADAIARALAVDRELSPLVQREFAVAGATLHVRYRATTARMLRVSVNGALESLMTALHVCEELDVEGEEGLRPAE